MATATATMTETRARVLAAKVALGPHITRLLYNGGGRLHQEDLDALVEKVAEQYQVTVADIVGGA